MKKLNTHKQICLNFQDEIQTEKGLNDLFSGNAFVSFETEEMKEIFVNYWQPSIL